MSFIFSETVIQFNIILNIHPLDVDADADEDEDGNNGDV